MIKAEAALAAEVAAASGFLFDVVADPTEQAGHWPFIVLSPPFAAFRRLSPPFAAFRRLSPPFTAVLLQTNLIADPTMASKIAAMNVSLQVRPHGNAGFLALKQCLSLQLEVEKFFSNQDKFGPAPHPAPRTSLQTARATV